MDKKIVILNDNDEIIANAYLESITAEEAVIRLNSAAMAKEMKNHPNIRFRISGNYVENYKGIVCKAEENKIHIIHLFGVDVCYRQDVKIDLNFKAAITYHQNNKLKSAQIQMKDISSGGLCFNTKQDLEMDLIYEIVISITKVPIILKLKIVRKLEPEEDGIFIYGCKFIDIGPDEEKLLREAVFRLHGLKYRRKKEIS